MDDGDWDLQAVVRGRRLADPAAAAERDPFSLFPPSDLKAETTDGDNAALTCNFSQLLEAPTALTELDQLCRPFLSPRWSHPSTATAAAVLSPRRPLVPPQRPQISRSKRSRKNQQKRVVYQVPADGASSDLWAWRKYGQKPIKGSPYPRGYYRCSSSKGCPARKQVERSRSDPAVLVITYSGEHNHALPTHRNSLAGSTRNKFPTAAAAAAAATLDSSPLSSSTAAGLSPTTPLTASMEDEEEDDEGALLIEDMEVMGEDEILFMPNFLPPTL